MIFRSLYLLNFSIILENGLILPECQVNMFYFDLKIFTHIKIPYILYINIYKDTQIYLSFASQQSCEVGKRMWNSSPQYLLFASYAIPERQPLSSHLAHSFGIYFFISK